jgi:hypothetical protein
MARSSQEDYVIAKFLVEDRAMARSRFHQSSLRLDCSLSQSILRLGDRTAQERIGTPPDGGRSSTGVVSRTFHCDSGQPNAKNMHSIFGKSVMGSNRSDI